MCFSWFSCRPIAFHLPPSSSSSSSQSGECSDADAELDDDYKSACEEHPADYQDADDGSDGGQHHHGGGGGGDQGDGAEDAEGGDGDQGGMGEPEGDPDGGDGLSDWDHEQRKSSAWGEEDMGLGRRHKRRHVRFS